MRKQTILRLFVLMAACLFLLSGCKTALDASGKAISADEEKGSQKKEHHYVFGFSAISMENPYFIALEASVREAVEAKGCELITMDPEGDSKKQSSQIWDMIEEGIDAIFLSPVDWKEITPSLKMLKSAGVKIINVDTKAQEMEYVDAYIGSNNTLAGEICGKDLLKRCPDGAKILILDCPYQNSINDRIAGFQDVIEGSARKKYEVVEKCDTNGEFERALNSAKECLQEYPDITVIMCGNDQIAVGAQTAVNVLGMENVIIYGVDGSPDIKKELKKQESQIAGTAAQSPINMGKEAAETAFRVMNKEPYEKEVYLDVFMINGDNVDDYGANDWQ